MDYKKELKELRTLYPGKKVYVDDIGNPSEILCEIESADINPDQSIYIAVIDKRIEHYHGIQTETSFEVIKGTLVL